MKDTEIDENDERERERERMSECVRGSVSARICVYERDRKECMWGSERERERERERESMIEKGRVYVCEKENEGAEGENMCVYDMYTFERERERERERE